MRKVLIIARLLLWLSSLSWLISGLIMSLFFLNLSMGFLALSLLLARSKYSIILALLIIICIFIGYDFDDMSLTWSIVLFVISSIYLLFGLLFNRH